MRADRWNQLKAVFADALQQPSDRRRAWLARACDGDLELGSHAEALLDAYEQDPDFLEAPAEIDPEDLVETFDVQPPAPVLAPGTILGDGQYRIVAEIGRGGMGIVYAADDLRLKRQVALKSIFESLRRDPVRLERFRREAWAAARITYHGVATVHAYEELAGEPYIVSEYVRGVSLRTELERGPLDTRRALEIATDIVRALIAAHEKGVVHRDLKPENIIVTDAGGIKVVDFGIAQLTRDESPGLTQEGVLLGTPAYMAPEQSEGSAVDARADIFSFGILFAEMLTGRHPLRMGSAALRGAAPGVASRLDAVGGSIPYPFGPIVARCVQLLPSERYASALKLLEDLERAGAGPADATSQGTAKWWWEFHQVAAATAYALMAVLAWQARPSFMRVDSALGALFSIMLVASVILSTSLRLNVWFASRYFPGQLVRIRLSRRRWTLGADIAFIATLTAGALMLIVHDERQLSVALLACAIGATVALTLIEPVTEQAAFGG